MNLDDHRRKFKIEVHDLLPFAMIITVTSSQNSCNIIYFIKENVLFKSKYLF